MYKCLCGQLSSFLLGTLLGYMVSAYLTFQEIAKLLAKIFYIPTNNAFDFQLLHTLANI